MEKKTEMLHLLQLAGLERFSSNIEQELGITTIKQLVDPNILHNKLKLIGMNECEVEKLNQTYKQNSFLKSPGYSALLKKTKYNKEQILFDFSPNDKNENNYLIWKFPNEEEKKYDHCYNQTQTLDDLKFIEKVYYDFPNKYDINTDEYQSPRSSCSSYTASNSLDSSQQMTNTMKGKHNLLINYITQFVKKKKKPNLSINITKENEECNESSEIKEMSDADMKELDSIQNLANRFVNLSKSEKSSPHSSTSPSSKKTYSTMEESTKPEGQEYFNFDVEKCNDITLSDDSSPIYKTNMNIESSTSVKKMVSIIPAISPNPIKNLYKKKVLEFKFNDYPNSVTRKRNKSESELKLPSKNPINLAKSKSADENLENHDNHVLKMSFSAPEQNRNFDKINKESCEFPKKKKVPTATLR